MLKILICEDNKKDKEHLKDLLFDLLQDLKIPYQIFSLQNMNVDIEFYLQFDMIFLDVRLKDQSGIELARKIRKMDDNILILITSRFKQYSIQAYTADVKRYFVKPIDKVFFHLEMKSILQRYQKDQIGFYDPKISRHKILFKNIICIEYLDRHTLLHFKDHQIISTTYPLKYWIQKTESLDFAQPYKSYIVNLDHVHKLCLERHMVLLRTGMKIPLSKKFRKPFKEQFYVHLNSL